MSRIYLDWNATAPLLPEVRESMVEALDSLPGNASSIHQDGQKARATVERARRAVASAVGAPAQGVVITGGATESNNQVLRSHVQKTDEPFVVCSAVEHPSVLEVVERLAEEGVRTAVCPVDRRGRPDLEWLEERLDAGATLVSMMLANNETGAILPVGEVAELIEDGDYDALLHVDGTQALGRIPVDFQALGVDIMTLSFHKMGGPKGIGAIVVREGLKVQPIMAGGHQERGRRPGTENVPAAAGLEAAAKAAAERTDEWRERLEGLRAQFLEQLEDAAGEIELRGHPEASLPNTVNVAFPGVDGEDLLLALDLEGISASSGSACTAGSLEPSHVILAMGYEEQNARRSVRFSFGPITTSEEIEQAAADIGKIVRRLGKLAEPSAVS